MGWGSVFSGYDAAARGVAVATAFDQNLDRFSHLSGHIQLANAVMATYEQELGAPSYSNPKMQLNLEIAPFAFLSMGDCMMAICEYVIFRERPKKANIPLLRSALQQGVTGLFADRSEQFDVARFGIFLVSINDDGTDIPWLTFMTEPLLGAVYDGGQASADRLKPKLEKRWKEQGHSF